MGGVKKDNNHWNEKENELNELLGQLEALNLQRKEIMKKVNSLKTNLRIHGICVSKKTMDTEVYKMFGKAKKDLTDEELKVYNAERQRVHRKTHKE